LATTTIDVSATFAEGGGGPNHSPFVCPPGTSCGSGEVVGLGNVNELVLFGGGQGCTCDLRTMTFTDGSTLVSEETGGNFSIPGQSYHQPPDSYGHPFTILLSDTIDGSLSTGRFAGATGTLTGSVSVAGGMAVVRLAGTI